ncbi:hypothetical protein GALMADRAFT_246320 [Galerina marginata CBS 339.88]|uniref:Cytochrome b-c1 complex subunit 8 n=1 Tax=Galerina marginata (strain CBS 339.88) TaxID=685588 RepID=A0A067T456_GALM3|nr:hypothetical protein GALMADRAFT_246320 [Galerina marginata CBS 339.88]
MRPTIARQSEMPGAISPFQTKAAPHWLKSYVFNGYRRLSGEILFFGIPFAVGYGVYTWAKGFDEWQNSKAGHLAHVAAGGATHE